VINAAHVIGRVQALPGIRFVGMDKLTRKRRVCGSAGPPRSRAARANSLRTRTGNFPSPCRELNQAITEFFGRIREEGAAIASPWPLSCLAVIIGGASVPPALALFKRFHRRRCDASRKRHAVKKAFADLV
jgi:hypothetical protein